MTTYLKCIVVAAVLMVLPLIVPVTENPALGAENSVLRIALWKAKHMLGKPNVLFVDVRTTEDIASSDAKIPGAPWENSHNVAAWASRYPKDKTLIFYCA
jgi:hypothetical protein